MGLENYSELIPNSFGFRGTFIKGGHILTNEYVTNEGELVRFL